MANPRDLANVRACLDDPFTPHLLALADWHEEAGQGALARAYRLMVGERRVPDVRNYGWCWLDDDGQLARYLVTRKQSVAVRQHLRAMGVIEPHRATLSQAYHALALAYAEEEGP